MTKAVKPTLRLLSVLAASFLAFSASSVSIPVHREHPHVKNSTNSTIPMKVKTRLNESDAPMHSMEVKTRLRGQSSSLFESDASSEAKEDYVSVDLGFLDALPNNNSKDSKVLENEVNDLFKMASMRTSMTKEQFDATPFGNSVKKISDLIEKVMMPKVNEAHKANQNELNKLQGEVKSCGVTKDEQVSKADKKKVMYLKFSPLHGTCRAGEAGQFSEKTSCWDEEADKKKIKDLKCKTFAMVSKQLGDQQASKQIMKKGGSESTESYINRMSSTVCGQCFGKGCGSKKGGFAPKKCGYEPYTCGCGFQCKFDKAKDDCEKATEEWEEHHKKCKDDDAQYFSKKTECDSLQDQMDDTSCKRAVEMKDACESYAECFFDKEKAYMSLETMVKKEEKDRKAEWKGLKRMKCLIEAFGNGKVTNSEINACKRKTHATDNLSIKYPKLPALEICEVPHHYPNTPSYKADNFSPLPALAKGKVDAYECTGLQEISTTPATGSPKKCKCTRVTLNGPYSPGPMVKCVNCRDIRRSLDKNSCPDGTKLFSPRSSTDWKTFLASASVLKAPNFIVDITRPKNGCGGCKSPMNSGNTRQKSWSTSDHSAWWLSGSKKKEPNGDYHANCYLDIRVKKGKVSYNDKNCKYHSKSYYCQAAEVNLTPKKNSPDGCVCGLVSLTGKYSAGSLIKCTGCLRVSKSMQMNSCPDGTKLFSPRTREDWKTFIASAAPLQSPHWIIDVTQGQNGCGGCTKSAMNSRSPAQATWRTADNSPWFLRSSKYSEPTSDYAANCYMNLASAVSEDSLTFNNNQCNYNSNAYYCQPAMKKKKEEPVDDEPEPPSPPPPPAKGKCSCIPCGTETPRAYGSGSCAPANDKCGAEVAGAGCYSSAKTVCDCVTLEAQPPAAKAGGKYSGVVCAAGHYTGSSSKCGHFTGLSEAECWGKCEKSASAKDKDSCDKETGVPECVASVWEKSKKTCILFRKCTKLTAWKGHPTAVTRIKSNYNPESAAFSYMKNRACKGDPYTRPDDEKEGLKGVTEAECKKACFENRWPGKAVPLKRCAATTFYAKTGYCDFFDKSECEKTKRKTGATTLKKRLADQTQTKSSKKKSDSD